jgi:hypothetical protein
MSTEIQSARLSSLLSRRTSKFASAARLSGQGPVPVALSALPTATSFIGGLL